MKNYKELIKSFTKENYKNDVNLHIHSTFSDGKVEPETLIEQAKAKGLKYIAISDHNTLNAYLKTDISKEEILARSLVSRKDYEQMETYTRALFQRGTEMAAAQGLILVDTKYEFGKKDGQILLMDEIHTPDSSRYFYAEGYAERQARGEKQRQLSKEFVREWLIANGFQGKEDQMMPVMPDEFVQEITDRYIELFEKVTGRKFVKDESDDVLARIERNILKAL